MGGFPVQAAQGLSLLLYSPGSHGGHIKWPPARAELATNLTPVPPGPEIRRARRGNVPCQKGTGLFWSVLSGKTPLFTVIRIHLLRSSENQTNNVQSTRPYNAKKAASPPWEAAPNLTNRRWQRVLLFRSLLLMCISCPQGLPRQLDRHQSTSLAPRCSLRYCAHKKNIS